MSLVLQCLETAQLPHRRHPEATRMAGPSGRREAAQASGLSANMWGDLCRVMEEGSFGRNPEEPVWFQKPP